MESIQARFHVPFRYPVHFTTGLFSIGNPLLAETIGAEEIGLPRKVLFVVDRGVVKHRPALIPAIEAYCGRHGAVMNSVSPPLILTGGEEAKNRPEYVATLHRAIDQGGLCRHAFLVAIGGGALIDMAGYAAATAHRGIRLIRVPTTVLAQNDAAVGVKNSVNAFGKKNFLGTFSPPFAVLNDALFLKTLSHRDWRSGLAEAVKVALVKDPAFFALLEEKAPLLVARDPRAMEQAVHRCAALHVGHITSNGDPFESGSSRPLDFGHWSAHKLERLSGFTLRHGEAVAVGIALDATYSHLAGFLDRAAWERILALLSALRLSCYRPELRHPDLTDGLAEFREHLGGPLTLLLLEGIGRPIEVHRIDPALLREGIALLEQAQSNALKGGRPWNAISSPAR